MIKLGIPNKGRLSDKSLEILMQAGFQIQTRERKLSAFCENFTMEVIFVRASDIPGFIQEGIIDLGITGQDLVKERGVDVEQILELDFGQAELILAVPKDFSKEQLFAKRLKIATSYPKITQGFCEAQGIEADVIDMSGAVELAPKLGLSDAIVDLTSSGETLRMNDLLPLMTLFETKACLFANREKVHVEREKIDQILMALQSVLMAKNQKFLIANLPKRNLAGLSEIAPGLSGPTVMSILGRKDLCAIQVVVNEQEITGVIDQLKKLGASGILVTNIEQMVP
jgi:ATP phosphoribosyltransferase